MKLKCILMQDAVTSLQKTAEEVTNEIAPASKKGGISSDSCEDTEGDICCQIKR